MRTIGSSAQKAFALTREVEGQRLIFVLKRGTNTIGRGRESDIVLSSRGVSDRHAVVEVEVDTLSVRDLASKNGTFVGGNRISSARVAIGDDVQVGPVTLRIEEVDPEDAFLSIRAQDDGISVGARAVDTNSSTVAWSGALDSLRFRRWLHLLDEITTALSAGLDASLGRGLATLCRGLDINGATLLRLPAEGSPIVIASFGDFSDGYPVASIEASREQAREDVAVQILGTSNESGSWTILAASRPAAPVLLLAGELPSEDVVAVLLRIVFRILSLHLGGADGKVETAEAGASRGLRFPKDYVPGDSSAMRAVYRQIGSVAGSELPLLLVGETGVGKECLAETVHLSSDRRSGPFLPINCAAIPSDLLEAELFGIGKGVATGVIERIGRFKLAEGGTLFLDEIGDMSAALQAKLLRALEEQVVRPVGGAPEEVDVRLIAATNTDLGRSVEAGRFRRDLYYRLAGLVVTIPALRRRMEDLNGLVEFFFHQARGESGRIVSGLTYGAMRRLAERRWPGNVRELRHAVHRLVFLCPDGQAIDSEMVAGLEEGALRTQRAPGDGAEPDFSTWENLDLAAMNRGILEEAMRRTDGNQTAAAALLRITRSSLRRRLVKMAASEEEIPTE